MARKLVLRNFLYLDDDGVRSAFSQAADGIIESTDVKQATSRSGAAKGAIKLPVVEAGGERTRGEEVSEEFSRLVTPESRFSAFFKLLEEEELISEIPYLDKQTWAGLETGELLNLTADVTLSNVDKAFQMMQGLKPLASSLGSILPALKTFGTTDTSEVEAVVKTLEAYEHADTGLVSVIASLVDSPQYRFVVRLKTAALRVSPVELEQTCRIIGFLDRKTQPGGRIPVSTATPDFLPDQLAGRRSKGPSRTAARTRTLRHASAPADPMFVNHPAAVITALAMYP